MQRWTTILFLTGLSIVLFAIITPLVLGQSPMLVGKLINASAVNDTGAANLVTAVVLAYRGLDTLGELAILFTAATAIGIILGTTDKTQTTSSPTAGFIVATAAKVLFPLLLVFALYIILHGHLTPGGGFQGGAVLAAAFFLLTLADSGNNIKHKVTQVIEALAGTAFIVLGLVSFALQGVFLQPWLDKGELGSLFSAGSLPLLYLALGLKVGAELANLLSSLANVEK